MDLSSEVTAIVTGGASGLGEATVRALAHAGVRVTIFDMNDGQGQALATEVGGLFCRVDITDEGSVERGFAAARAAQGVERILINCAGGGRPGKTISRDRATGAVEPLSADQFAGIIALNLTGTFRCISRGAAGMATLDPVLGERGVIIATASAAAVEGQIGQVAYAAAKAGVVGMILPVARDLAAEGIRINAIMPGIFDTPPMRAAPGAVKEQLSASVPFPKRLGRPAEFATLALELCRNGYLNGEVVRLDGAIRMPPR